MDNKKTENEKNKLLFDLMKKEITTHYVNVFSENFLKDITDKFYSKIDGEENCQEILKQFHWKYYQPLKEKSDYYYYRLFNFELFIDESYFETTAEKFGFDINEINKDDFYEKIGRDIEKLCYEFTENKLKEIQMHLIVINSLDNEIDRLIDREQNLLMDHPYHYKQHKNYRDNR